jgi:MFS family permease
VILGMTLGAVEGGIVMAAGRRKMAIYASFIGILGVLVSLNLNLYSILIGRLLVGISIGAFSTIIPRFLEETIPSHVYDQVAATFTLS